MTVRTYKELIVWQKAIDLVESVYELTSTFPKTEQYGLVSQMRRAAVSVPSNIAEGHVGRTRKDYRGFVMRAYGSGAELETQAAIVERLQLGTEKSRLRVSAQLTEVQKMLNAIIRKLADNPVANS